MKDNEDGLGILEAVIAMSISFLVITTLLNIMLASSKQLATTVKYHATLDESDSTVSLLSTDLADADWQTASVVDNDLIVFTRGQCEEWKLNGDVLGERTWTSPDTAPADFTIRLQHVTSYSMTLDSNVFLFSWSAKQDATTPTVKVEREVASTYVAVTPSPSVDPFGSPVAGTLSNPCTV